MIPAMDASPRQLIFDGYRLDPRTRVLLAPDGVPVSLNPKALDVLIHLLSHADRVVGKDELLEAVWEGRVVEENTLTQAVSMLRRALGTGAGDHRFVVTVPGRGYRFVAEIQAVDAVHQSARGNPPDSASLLPGSLTVLLPVVIAALLLAALIATRVGPAPAPAIGPEPVAKPTLAILPFRQMSEDPRDDLLALGLADTLITRLSRHAQLRVRALGSSEHSAGLAADPLAAGATLGAHYVVDGSTQRSGERVRVNARLLVLPGGEALWADTYDTVLSDVFTVQDDIAHAVAAVLALSADSLPAGTSAPCDGDDAEAYRAYLSGRHLLQTPSRDGLRRAIAEFRRALEMDPTCARAWAGQAFAWRGLAITGDQEPFEVFPIAKAAVERALELDPDLAEAYASRGFIQFWHDWDWAAAEASLLRAIELNPSLAEARFSYAHLLSSLGHHQEALLQVRQARELDPLSPLINTLEASFLDAAGHAEEARTRVGRVLELAPDFWIALLARATMAMTDGDVDAAVEDMERAVTLSSGATQALAVLGAAYVRAGRSDDAREILQDLEARAADGYVPSVSIAALHLALGDQERSIDRLEQALQERDLRLTFLKVERRWDSLRNHPRFIAILQGMRLTDQQRATDGSKAARSIRTP